MKSLLLAVLLILGANCISKLAGYDSSDKSEAPAIRKYNCDPVQDKKPWCACRSSLSSIIIDLSSLGTEEGFKNLNASIRPPKFRSINGVQGWFIAWSPCEDFDLFTNITLNPDEKACKGVGFARYYTAGKICNGYGSHENSAKFYSYGHDVKTGIEKFYIEFHFTTKVEVRTARIWLMCTQDSDKNILKYNGDHAGTEVAHFYSKCCCPNNLCGKSRNDPPKRYKLGTGAIAGISVAVVAVIAIIAIVMYKRKRHPFPIPVEIVAQEQDERHPLVG